MHNSRLAIFASKFLLRLTAFILFVSFYGCKQSEFFVEQNEEVVLRSVSTRSGKDDKTHPLPAGAEVGIFAAPPNSYSYFADNLHYISDGNALIAQAQKLQFRQGVTSAVVYAYAPYLTNVEYNMPNIAIETDQNANGTAASDILWGSAAIEKQNNAVTVPMARKMSLIRVNLVSKNGDDISNAKVELLNLYCAARMDIQTGGVSMITSYTPSTIRMRLVESTNYEAVILPQALGERAEFIRVTLRSKTYVFKTAPKMFEAGKAYDFDITIRDDVSPTLECALTVTYDSRTLGNSLNIPAKATDKYIEVTTDRPAGKTFKLRNESGEECWASIISIGVGSPNQIAPGDAWSKLHFEENLGPERKMTLEFYDKDLPRAVYKRVVITQLAASDYLNLSTQTITADKMGTVYDIPFEVNATSNLSWTIDNSEPWIDVQYTSGVKNQLIKINLQINNTGATRSGVVRLMVEGREVKQIQVTQSAVESPTFTLRYELNIDITTYGNWFVHDSKYYPDELHMFNYYPSEYGDETAKIQTSAPYGFVVDAPNFNKIEVRGFRHGKFLTVRNYSGRATTIHDANISVMCHRIGYPFFRSFRVDIPIPAGVKRNQMVRYHMQFVDTQHIMYYPVPTIQTTIINQ